MVRCSLATVKSGRTGWNNLTKKILWEKILRALEMQGAGAGEKGDIKLSAANFFLQYSYINLLNRLVMRITRFINLKI